MSTRLDSALVTFALLQSAALGASLSTGLERTIHVDGLERRYLVFVPSKLTEPMPVVVVLHGGGGTALQI